MSVYGITTTPVGESLHIIDQDALSQYMTLRSEMRDVTNPRKQVLCATVTRLIEEYTDRAFVERNVVEYLDGNGESELFLSFGPVTAVNSLKVEATTADLAAGTALVEGTDYDVDEDRGLIYLYASTFSEGRLNVLVDYETGYDDASNIMAQARGAFSLQALAFWREWDGQLVGLQSNQSGEKQETRIQATSVLIPEVKAMLAHLRRMVR